MHVRYLVKLGDDYAADSPDHVYITIGTLDSPEVVELGFHFGVESQLPWVHFDDNLPRIRSDEDPDLINALSLEKDKEI